MGRFYIKDNQIKDDKKEIYPIDISKVTNDELVDILNYMEMESLKYKRELNTLKHRIKRLVEQ